MALPSQADVRFRRGFAGCCARKLDETMELFPPPGERFPAGPDALLLSVTRLEMLRAEVRRREKPVREALRARSPARLKRLDIPVDVDAAGDFVICGGVLLNEETRVLTDPLLHGKRRPSQRASPLAVAGLCRSFANLRAVDSTNFFANLPRGNEQTG